MAKSFPLTNFIDQKLLCFSEWDEKKCKQIFLWSNRLKECVFVRVLVYMFVWWVKANINVSCDNTNYIAEQEQEKKPCGIEVKPKTHLATDAVASIPVSLLKGIDNKR